jgi:hypothetical protein
MANGIETSDDLLLRRAESHSLLKPLSSLAFNPRRENKLQLERIIRRVQPCNPKMQLVQSLAQRRRAQARRYLCLGDDFKEGGYLQGAVERKSGSEVFARIKCNLTGRSQGFGAVWYWVKRQEFRAVPLLLRFSPSLIV